MDVSQKNPDWHVLLIGGPSAVGKTTVSKRVGLSCGVPWMPVDDLRLAFRRASARLPSGTDALYYFDDAPHVWRQQPEALCKALIAVGEALVAPLEAVIENHVDTSSPVVIEGDGIIPSLFSRPSVTERKATGAIRAVFLIEPDESKVLENILSRGRGITGQTQEELRTEARAKWLFGQWLSQEAERHNLEVMEPRPWETLVNRLVDQLA